MPQKSTIIIDREKLAEILRIRRMSQNKLATYAQLNQSIISRILSGKQTGVNSRTLFAISEVLKVQPHDLLVNPDAPIEDEEDIDQADRMTLDEKTIWDFLDAHPEIMAGMAKIIRGRPRAVLRTLETEILNYVEEVEEQGSASRMDRERTDPGA